MNKILSDIVSRVASLKLTITCLVLLMVIVFWGTLDQVNIGIFETQKKYFQSLFVFVQIKNKWLIPVFPGGMLICLVLTLNLIAATGIRIKFWLNRKWLLLSHTGILILLIGGALSYAFSSESQMPIMEGASKNYSQSTQEIELVFVDKSDVDVDKVFSIPQNVIEDNEVIKDSRLPFELRIKAYLPNADLTRKTDEFVRYKLPEITQGIGNQISVTPKAKDHTPDAMNYVTAFVEVIYKGESLGTWLLSHALAAPQILKAGGKEYEVYIRSLRFYEDYYITLKDFKHDLYPGTNIPKNYSSEITLHNPTTKESRDALIYMNHPLRYKGKTYFQASFGEDDKLSVFQVVENPSWLIPYITCAMVSVGLIMHFLLGMIAFASKRKKEKI